MCGEVENENYFHMKEFHPEKKEEKKEGGGGGRQ